MRTAALLTVVVLGFFAGARPAQAMVESCPARLSALQAAGNTPSSSIYTYSLGALSQRTLDATMIADTDRGWFSWSVAGVPLVRVERTDTAGTWPIRYQAWSTDALAVALPAGAAVKHAGVTSARGTHESTFNWDVKGTVACEAPAFDATPSPAPPAAPPPAAVVAAAAAAVPAAAPFDPPSCPTPFVAAAIVSGPALNAAALGSFNEGLAAEAAVIDVAIDGSGAILDAWIEARPIRPSTGWRWVERSTAPIEAPSRTAVRRKRSSSTPRGISRRNSERCGGGTVAASRTGPLMLTLPSIYALSCRITVGESRRSIMPKYSRNLARSKTRVRASEPDWASLSSAWPSRPTAEQ